MKKVKVLIFNPKITAGGISKILSDFIVNFNNEVDVDILTLSIENDIYVKDLDVNIYTVGKSKNILKRIYSEYKIMKHGNYDAIHINGDYVSRVIECISAKIAGIKKIIIHSHSSKNLSNKKIKYICQNIFKKLFDYIATDYIACSKEAAIHMFSRKIIKERKYRIIKNGINIDKFKYSEKLRNEIRKKYKLENQTVIGYVGRLSSEKNPLFLLETFNEYNKKNKNSTLLIIGTGVLREQLDIKVNEYGLQNKVLFLENKKDVYNYYNAMDCLILPSFHEGLGIVSVESQTSGLPTLVSTGVPQIAKISELIKFVPLNKGAKFWSDSININDCRKNFYKNAINNGYDIKKCADDLLKVYNNK